MKMALLCEFYEPHMIGGAEMCSKFIAEGLAKKGIEIHVITPNLDSDEDVTLDSDKLKIHRFKSPFRKKLLSQKSRSVSKTARNQNLKIFTFFYNFYKKWSGKDLANAFKKIDQRERFDLVCANNIEPALALNYIKTKIPKIAYIRDQRIYDFKIKATNYIAINERQKQMALEKWNIDATVINDPVEDYKISNLTKEQAREKLKIKYNEVVLFAGHFMWQTDPSILVEIAARVQSVAFILCGSGAIEIKPKSDNLFLVGKIDPDKISAYYKAADIAIYPCVMNWGFSLMIIEAMANGTPVISYDVKGIDEVIQPDVNGIITDKEHLEEEIKALLSDKKKLSYLSAEAEKIKQRFNKDALLEKLKTFLEEQ